MMTDMGKVGEALIVLAAIALTLGALLQLGILMLRWRRSSRLESALDENEQALRDRIEGVLAELTKSAGAAPQRVGTSKRGRHWPRFWGVEATPHDVEVSGMVGAELRVTPKVDLPGRPLPPSPVALTPKSEHRGEAWLAIGTGPVDARQLALVMAKLPAGTTFIAVEDDDVNGEHARRMGFQHWSFAGPDPVKYPNKPRLWVSWASDEEPVVSWPVVGE